MEEKLARWRAQAEAQRLQDKDSAVSRARASRLSRENADDEANEDSILNDDNIGGPRGSARRTVVERMRELKISERRAEISEDVQRMREVEEDEKDREQRVQAQQAERLRIEQEIQEDAKKWAERKRAYWKEGFDAVKDVPAPDPRSGGGKQTQQGLAREIFLDAIGVQNRPLAGINAKLQDWKEMSAARKARQVGRVSVDLAVTIMNAVAIAMGIILQKPVQVPETSFRGESIRATSETLGAKFLSSVLGWGSTTLKREEKQAANVPTWKDLGPAVSTILQASDQATVAVPGISDVGAEYEAMADEETNYLQQKLREKWRKKALDKRAQRAIPNVPAQAPYVPSMEDACIKMAALIKEGDYGGVRALLRDTIEAPEVYRVLLGFDSSEYQYGNPCLILAAQLGRGDIVEALRNAGANMRVLDERGRTASQVAEEAGHLALAKNLITWVWTCLNACCVVC